ncbi:MAG: glycosyl transferase [Pseudomonadales bacterium]|nr:glycosyl transferase [Pseudomonadales bacterium]
MCLVYLSPVPWASFAQRPHKFVEWFHKCTGRSIVWVDTYPTRFPQLNDFMRVGKDTKANHSIPSWLTILTPHALPIEPLPGSGWLNRWLWRGQMKALTLLREQAPLVVIGKPSVLALQVLKTLKPDHSVYDCMDDFSAFYSGLSRKSMKHRELQLASDVSEVWASSSMLNDRWQRKGLKVRQVPNALDADLLPKRNTAKMEAERKTFGYVGTMGPWFDWAWVVALAEVRSKDVIRLIGPVFGSVPDLPRNVQLLPPCNHESALRAMLDFDVGLIPFKINKLTASVDPIKYYEYRALGLPLISTCFGEMRFRVDEPGSFICSNIDDITHIAAAAVSFEHHASLLSEFVRNNTWERRFQATGLV